MQDGSLDIRSVWYLMRIARRMDMNNMILSNYTKYLLLLYTATRVGAFPSELQTLDCIKDDDGKCCPPVSICGGALDRCNGCPNRGERTCRISR
jgi:hypothetical protein